MFYKKLKPSFGINPWIVRGDRARDERRWAEAAASYEKALEQNSELPHIWVQFGHALKESGSLAEAEAAYRKSIELSPGLSDTHLQLGHALKLQHRPLEASASYVQALRLDPRSEHAVRELRALGWPAQDVDDIVSSVIPDGNTDRPAMRRGREPGAPLEFDESRYLSMFADVRLLIELGVMSSARQHYELYGFRQGRDVLMSLAEVAPSRAIVLCPSFFKRCGIGEHARYLADCLEAAGLETFRIRSTRELARMPHDLLRDAVLIVNHGPGLFDGYNPELSEGEATMDLLVTLRDYLARVNLRPVVFMHSLLDRDNEVMFPRQQLLLNFPIPVATTIEAAARAFNIFRVEHGLQPIATIAQRPFKPNQRDYPTIGFFGFFQWGGKNFDALFDVARVLKAKLIGSVATRDHHQVQQLRKMLEERDIVCDLGTGWVEDTELAARLAEADYYYLPQHDHDHWNNSGTARFVMNFGRPVIVPAHSPFLDLREVAIFADEGDLPAVLAWMRDETTYKEACQRTSRYAERHPMAHEMPKLAKALHEIASESGAANFVSDNLFTTFSLAGLEAPRLAARVAHRTGKRLEETSDAAELGALRDANPQSFALAYPFVEEVRYWRRHFELEEFFYPTAAETCFAIYRMVLKRDPSFIEFGLATSELAGTKGAVPVAAVLKLLMRVCGREPGMDFAGPVELYDRGAFIDPPTLASQDLQAHLERRIAHRLAVCEALPPVEVPAFGRPADRNLFQILMLRDDWVDPALGAVIAASGAVGSVKGVGAAQDLLARYMAACESLAKSGLRTGDIFLQDEPLPSAVDYGRAVYSISDFWPMRGAEFVIHLIRCLRKRDPFPSEMWSLRALLENRGKLATIREVMAMPGSNGRVIDSDQSALVDDLQARASQLGTLVSRFRSAYSGGWDLRNDYLERKRNLSRLQLRLQPVGDAWSVQQGQLGR